MEWYEGRYAAGLVAPAPSPYQQKERIASSPKERVRSSLSARLVQLRSRRDGSFLRFDLDSLFGNTATHKLSDSNRSFSFAQESLRINHRNQLFADYSKSSIPDPLFSSECLGQLSHCGQLTHAIDA